MRGDKNVRVGIDRLLGGSAPRAPCRTGFLTGRRSLSRLLLGDRGIVRWLLPDCWEANRESDFLSEAAEPGSSDLMCLDVGVCWVKRGYLADGL